VAQEAIEKKQKKRRKVEPEARRRDLLDAGLAVFAADGFAAAKLDDVAAKAGVAKGTIYLYFRDKEDLFEQIVRRAIAPVLAHLQSAAAVPDLPANVLFGSMFEMFRMHVLETDRKHIIRLVVAEGARFPKLAELYHREVIVKGMDLVRQIVRQGVARGEIASPDLERFPQLVMAPLLAAVLWDGLFSTHDPLDTKSLLAAHCRLLTSSQSD
jgi:AcrR family transcriptional regulator